mgnify:CR=1 FL=1
MKLIKSVASLAILLVCTQVQAGGTAENSKVLRIGTGPYFESICGVTCVAVQVDPAPTGQAACQYTTGNYWDYAIDTSTPAGQQMYSHILAAQMSDKPLNFVGTGSCISTNTYEKLNYSTTPR